MTPIASAAQLKLSGNLSSGWWACLAIRPAWEFALSKNGELFARRGFLRAAISVKAVDVVATA